MKTTTPRLFPALLAGMSLVSVCEAATISQNFEAGEDTSAWGAAWTGGGTTAAFLNTTAGGLVAGDGSSSTQGFSRSFKNNTVGLDLAAAYSITMDVQVNAFDGPSGGQFEIVDGAFGSGNAANLRIFTEDLGGGNFAYHWQARDNSTGWQDLGINLDLASPYNIELLIDPESFTYSATVKAINAAGTVLDSASLSGLAFDPNVITNGQNGNLLFYVQASVGGTEAMVDNINIQTVPEPSSLALASLLLPWLAGRRRRSN